MLKNRSIAFRLSVLILSSTTLIFTLLFIYNYINTSSLFRESVVKSAENLAEANVNKIETYLNSVEKAVKNLSLFAGFTDYSEKELSVILSETVKNTDELYGSTIAFEPYKFNFDLMYYAPYYYKSDNKIKYLDLADDNYNYLNWDWYQIPKKRARPVWSAPYFDKGAGNIMMTTYSYPFYEFTSDQESLKGIVTGDVSLQWLKDLLNSIKIYKTGFAFLISKDGTFISHTDSSLIMKATIFDLAKSYNNEKLFSVGEKMINGKKGLAEILIDNNKYLIYHFPISSNGWSLGIIFPEKEFLSEFNLVNRNIIIIGCIGASLLFIIIIMISKTIARPIETAVKSAEAIAKGNILKAGNIVTSFAYGYKIRQKEGMTLKNEALRLFRAIHTMTEKLSNLIYQVKATGSRVDLSAENISESALDIENAVSGQASSTQEIFATSIQISETSKKLSTTMGLVNDSLSETASTAEKGKDSLRHLHNAMNQLINATGNISSRLSMISQKAKSISSIALTINSISDQTNLLSINAAIEAEKAGDYGRGFSIVAKEITRLADQTALATHDIENMISEMQESVSSGVMEMETFSKEVVFRVEEVDKLNTQFTDIIESVKDLHPEFQNVAKGMESQSESAIQINEAINHLAEVAMTTKNSLINFSNATKELNNTIEDMMREVERFKTGDR